MMQRFKDFVPFNDHFFLKMILFSVINLSILFLGIFVEGFQVIYIGCILLQSFFVFILFSYVCISCFLTKQIQAFDALCLAEQENPTSSQEEPVLLTQVVESLTDRHPEEDVSKVFLSNDQNQDVEEDDPRQYILDSDINDKEFILEALNDTRPPWVLGSTEGYNILAKELCTRKMDSMVISFEQFKREWFQGIEQTQKCYLESQEEGKVEMVMRGCPVSDFTEVVESMRMTARRDMPASTYMIKHRSGDVYRVGVSRGNIKFICRCS